MLVNIGLNVNDGSVLHPQLALAALRSIGGARVLRWSLCQSDSEPTVVAEVDSLTGSAAFAVSDYLRQDAIAVYDRGEGWLFGPRAEAWGSFNPAYFFGLDGRRVATAAA